MPVKGSSVVKKLILILACLVILPVATFAETAIGGAVFYKSPVLLGQPVDTTNLNVSQFAFGADGRIKLGWLQGEGLLLYSAGDVSSLILYLDAGIALDVSVLRLSLGVGPNLSNTFGQSPAVQAGLNAKVGADVMIGPISIGLSYIMAMSLDNGLAVRTSSGLIGLQVLYWM
jgi:hypothetical protein